MSEPKHNFSRRLTRPAEEAKILEQQDLILQEIVALSRKIDSLSETLEQLKGPFAEKLRGFVKREISSKIESIFHQRTTDQEAE